MSRYHSFIIYLNSGDRNNDVVSYMKNDYILELRQFGLSVNSVTLATLSSSAGDGIEVRHSFSDQAMLDEFAQVSLQLKTALEHRFVDTGAARKVEEKTGEIVYDTSLIEAQAAPSDISLHGHTTASLDKSKWPELKNLPVEEARRVLTSERPDLQVHEVPQGAMVTMDFRTDRVRIFHRNGKVTTIPQIG